MFQLPHGYSFAPADEVTEALSVPVGGYKGADISRERDAQANVYVACCARNPAGQFGFRVFRQPAAGGAFVEVPLPAFAEGRGEIDVDQFDGKIHFIAWHEDGTFESDVVPGCAAFPVGVALRGPQGIPGPKGDKGDPGPAGAGGALSDDDKRRLGWLATWLAPLVGG